MDSKIYNKLVNRKTKQTYRHKEQINGDGSVGK